MIPKTLTRKQKHLLWFVEDKLRDHAYPYTVRQVLKKGKYDKDEEHVLQDLRKYFLDWYKNQARYIYGYPEITDTKYEISPGMIIERKFTYNNIGDLVWTFNEYKQNE